MANGKTIVALLDEAANATELAKRYINTLQKSHTNQSEALREIREIILNVENRCMAADGPVTNTRHEMTDDELRKIFVLAGGKIHL